jgi:antitoxin (DNA-binding transcriptional repressor) of toxin-antitoxin stability system
MSRVSVEEAARNFKALLEQVARGEEVIVVEQD